MTIVSRIIPAVLLVIGTAHAAAPLPKCDRNGDGVVELEEVQLCAYADFNNISRGRRVLEPGEMPLMRGERIVPTFQSADGNSDGELTREEWARFTRRRFSIAARDGRMTTEEFRAWLLEGMP